MQQSAQHSLTFTLPLQTLLQRVIALRLVGRFVGSQTGEFRGKAPTGQRVSVPGITVFHLLNGKINEMWIAFDPARLVTRVV